jgi:hypothetical protein
MSDAEICTGFKLGLCNNEVSSAPNWREHLLRFDFSRFYA